MGLFASPGYLASHKKITKISDLNEHKMILSNFYRKVGQLEMDSGEVCPLTHYNFVSDNMEALLYAVVNGMGLLFSAPMYIKNELAQGKVVRILPEVQTAEMRLWAFYPNTEFMPVKTRLFLDYLKERL